MTKEMIKFDLPKNQSSIIKVLGVGGGGSNAVNHMFKQGIEGVDFIVCNTDSQALDMSPVPNKIQLGVSLTEGRGAGSLPEVGKNAAIEDLERIKEVLDKGTKMLFITAGMGGGTGTGAAPVIASASKEMGILTVGIVTIPFMFEGRKRRQQAEEGIKQLQEHVDTLLVICNDRLRELYGNLSVTEAFARADNVLTTAAKGIAEIITLTGNINVDFADVKTVMSNSGVAIMGSGNAEGENRSIKAIEMALSSPLLNDNNIRGAKNILLNITSGTEEILMDEITEITDYIQDESGSTAEIIWGLGKDESLGSKINVTLVATGFGVGKGYQPDQMPEKKVIKMDQETEKARHVGQNEPYQEEAGGMRKYTRQNPPAEKTPDNKPEIRADQPAVTFEFPVSEDNNSFRDSKATPSNQNAPYQETRPEEEPMANPVSEAELQRKIRDREQRLRELSMKLKTPEGLQDLERQPAFVRRNVNLNNTPLSSESQVSRYTLNEGDDEKVQIKSNNSFLHDNVD
ncbi:MAG: cell division protein FtsZ [Bacteroides sp.]|jgi:cell division protein FtsZ|nr:cell division protein FtsZ [Bacteroides sp.]